MSALRFTEADVNAANSAWGFNCGPAAICAALGLTPAELFARGVEDFIAKGYTNPTLMISILQRLGVRVVRKAWPARSVGVMPLLANGLVRIQWSGPWTNPGVPAAAAYRQTHWVAVRDTQVFDINAMSEGGWLIVDVWRDQLAPWIVKHCVPRGDGRWWAATVLETNRSI